MIIRKEHAIALRKLLAEKNNNAPYSKFLESETPVLLELERAGLINEEKPLQWVLTYAGEAVATVLNKAYENGAVPHIEGKPETDIEVKEALKLDKPEDWADDFRWIGSEIIAMLDAANRAGRVGPKSVEQLIKRGLAVRVYDKVAKKEYTVLSEAGKSILDIYENAHPRLIIDAKLADFIRNAPIGPAETSRLPLGSHEEHLLEAMRLIAYSVPSSDVFAFTALGQAVKHALENGGFGSETCFSEEIMWNIAHLADGEEVPKEALALLQELAFVNAENELLPAGEWALEAFRIWHDGPRKDVWTFAVEAEEVGVLQTIETLAKKYEEVKNESVLPTFDNIRREMIDRKVKEYKKLLERYGRKIKEIPEKFRKIAEQFSEAKDFAKWYDDNFMLRESLYSLESFNMVESVKDEKTGKEVFAITKTGKAVLEEQNGAQRDISSTAVKAITMTRKMFSAPSIEWFREAQEAKLVGTAEPTKSGYLYAKLSETLQRKPHLTKFELEVFHTIPAKGVTEQFVYEELEKRGYDEEKIRWALEKLEARHLIETLPDGNIVETDAGVKMDEALSGTPAGLGNPINPLIYRVLEALRKVGTLYVKEEKVRILPRNIKEALKLSGLSKDAFDDAVKVAKVAGFLGKNSITRAGLLVLEAVKEMNPQEGSGLDAFVE